MDADLSEIRSFLAAHHPFDLLPASDLESVARNLEISFIRRGTVVMKPGDSIATLYVVRTGAVETRDPDGHLLARSAEGECFGMRALLRGGHAVNRIEAIEDCLVYLLPVEEFNRLRRDHPPFAYYFAAFEGGGRLRDSYEGAGGVKSMDLLTKEVGDLLVRGPVTIGAAVTIAEAAVRMSEQRVSCLLVTEGESLVGIITDRDLRNRVVSRRLDYDTPVTEVMTRDPYTVETSELAFTAMMLMSRHNCHHLPVVDKGRIVGCLTSTTLVESHTTSPLYLARNIHACATPQDLAEVVRRIPHLVQQMAEWGATANSIGHVVSTLTDSVTVRLCTLAEQRLGPPPVPYVWLAAGSQARDEQTALSDQDNCLVLHDDYDAAAHGEYFRQFSRFVCEGLNTAGYVFCPGEMMAMTDKWRQPLATWKEYFRGWIETPEPKALMLSCVFFDLRPVHGDTALYQTLHELVLEKSKKNRIFLAHMARNALSHEPPIGFFRNFVLIHGGDHDHTFDLKHNGVVPIVDLARCYALASGIGAVNTTERLEACAGGGAVSRQGAEDLIDALEFIALTRLRHQARMINEGKTADNFMSPDEMSSFERSHLKNAFSVVKTMQASLAQAFQLGRF